MKWVALGTCSLMMLFVAQQIAYWSQPWAMWWAQKPGTEVRAITAPTLDLPSFELEPRDPSDLMPPVIAGNVTDVQRYQLARAAGWTAEQAVLAAAISIAENGSGNPAALSAENFDKSRDLGLWQINSGWWPRFGGSAALIVPVNNASAAHTIYTLQGWCAWSTYDASCGRGHTGSYRAFMARAEVAARAVIANQA